VAAALDEQQVEASSSSRISRWPLVLRCAEPGVCLGGVTGSCREDRIGLACSGCAEHGESSTSLHPAPFGGLCGTCSKDGLQEIAFTSIAVLVIIVVLPAVVTQLSYARAGHECIVSLVLAWHTLQMAALSVEVAVARLPEMLSVSFATEDLSAEDDIEQRGPPRMWRTLVALLTFDATMLWPSCLVGTFDTMPSSVILGLIFPAVLLVSSALLDGTLTYIFKAQARASWLRTLGVRCFLFMPSLSKLALRPLECAKQPGGGWTWAFAEDLQDLKTCSDGRSWVAPFASLAFSVYVLAPMCFFFRQFATVLLAKQRADVPQESPRDEDAADFECQLSQRSVEEDADVSIIAINARLSNRVWPMVMLCRTVFCSSTVAIFSGKPVGECWASLATVCVHIVYVGCSSCLRPWRTDGLNRADCGFGLLCVLVSVLVLPTALPDGHVFAPLGDFAPIGSNADWQLLSNALFAVFLLVLIAVSLHMLVCACHVFKNDTADEDRLCLAADLMEFALSLCAADQQAYQNIWLLPSYDKRSVGKAVRLVLAAIDGTGTSEDLARQQKRHALQALSLRCALRFALPEVDELGEEAIKDDQSDHSQDLQGFQTALNSPAVRSATQTVAQTPLTVRSSVSSMLSMRDLLHFGSRRNSAQSVQSSVKDGVHQNKRSRPLSEAQSRRTSAQSMQGPAIDAGRRGLSTRSSLQSSGRGTLSMSNTLTDLLQKRHSFAEKGHIGQLRTASDVGAGVYSKSDACGGAASSVGTRSSFIATAVATATTPAGHCKVDDLAASDVANSSGSIRSTVVDASVATTTTPASNCTADDHAASTVDSSTNELEDSEDQDAKRQRWLERRQRKHKAKRETGTTYGNWLKGSHSCTVPAEATDANADPRQPTVRIEEPDRPTPEASEPEDAQTRSEISSVCRSQKDLWTKSNWKSHTRKSAVSLHQRYRQRDTERQLHDTETLNGEDDVGSEHDKLEVERTLKKSSSMTSIPSLDNSDDQEDVGEAIAEDVPFEDNTVALSTSAVLEIPRQEQEDEMEFMKQWEKSIIAWRMDPRGCLDDSTVEILQQTIKESLPELSSQSVPDEGSSQASGSERAVGRHNREPPGRPALSRAPTRGLAMGSQSIPTKNRRRLTIGSARKETFTSLRRASNLGTSRMVLPDWLDSSISSALPVHSGLSTVAEQSHASSIAVSRRQSHLSNAISEFMAHSRRSSVLAGGNQSRRSSVLVGSRRQSIGGNALQDEQGLPVAAATRRRSFWMSYSSSLMPTHELKEDEDEIKDNVSRLSKASSSSSDSSESDTASAEIDSEAKDAVGNESQSSGRLLRLLTWTKNSIQRLPSREGLAPKTAACSVDEVADKSSAHVVDDAADKSSANGDHGTTSSSEDSDESDGYAWVDPTADANVGRAVVARTGVPRKRGSESPNLPGATDTIVESAKSAAGQNELNDTNDVFAEEADVVAEHVNSEATHFTDVVPILAPTDQSQSQSDTHDEPAGAWKRVFRFVLSMMRHRFVRHGPPATGIAGDGVVKSASCPQQAPSSDNQIDDTFAHSSSALDLTQRQPAAASTSFNSDMKMSEWLFPQSSLLRFITAETRHSSPLHSAEQKTPCSQIIARPEGEVKAQSGSSSTRLSVASAAAASTSNRSNRSEAHSTSMRSEYSTATDVMLHGLLEDISKERGTDIEGLLNMQKTAKLTSTHAPITAEQPAAPHTSYVINVAPAPSSVAMGSAFSVAGEGAASSSEECTDAVITVGDFMADPSSSSSCWTRPIAPYNSYQDNPASVVDDAKTFCVSSRSSIDRETDISPISPGSYRGDTDLMMKTEKDERKQRWLQRREEKKQKRKDASKKRSSAQNDWARTYGSLARLEAQPQCRSDSHASFNSNVSLDSSISRASSFSSVSSASFVARAEPADCITIKMQVFPTTQVVDIVVEEKIEQTHRREWS